MMTSYNSNKQPGATAFLDLLFISLHSSYLGVGQNFIDSQGGCQV